MAEKVREVRTMRNKEFTRTDKPKTTLSVTKDSVVLSIGTDLAEDKLGPFLDVIDGLMTNLETEQYYGHFSFSQDKVEITLSKNKEGPNYFDITYAHRLRQ